MDTKKLFFGVCTCLVLMASACTDSSADDQIYEDGMDKSKIHIKGVDKSKIHIPD